MKLCEYLEMQQDDIVFAFNNSGRFPVGLSSINSFPNVVKREDHHVMYDPRVRNKKAFIRKYNGKYEYWVDISYTRYRKAFLNFIEEYYGVDLKEVSSGFDADHILNRVYAKKFGVKYVRMCLIASLQNRSYGRQFEKNMANIDQSKRSIFLMDYLCAMKVMGVPIPKSFSEYQSKKSEIIRLLKSKGVVFHYLEAEEELDYYFKEWMIFRK
ncbi:hypothetical protein [Vibrio parahaemolyticus]